jgi:hypothetical protein
MSRRRTRCLELVFAGLACACVASCGGVTETPDPPPQPITSRAFVHLLDTQAEALRTYDVSEMTAQLAPVASVGAPGAALLAIQPSGGVLYTLGKATDNRVSTLRSFALDARTGALTALAQERLGCEFGFLTVSSERLFAGGENYSRHSYSHYVAFELRPDGSFSPTTKPRSFGTQDAYVRIFAGSGSRLTYLREDHSASLHSDDYPSGRLLTAHAPTEDGTFVLQEGILRLAFASSTGLPAALDEGGTGIVVGQILYYASGQNLASFWIDPQDGALHGRALLPNALPKAVDYSLPELAQGPDGLLAVAFVGEIRLFRVSANGDITPAGGATVPVKDGMVFHPSGQFLYAGTDQGLHILRIQNGAIAPFVIQAGVPVGPMVATRPAS